MSKLQMLHPKKWDDNYELTGKGVDRKDQGLFQDTIIVFAWQAWGKSWKKPHWGEPGFWDKNQAQDFPNTKHLSNQLHIQ